MAEPKDPLERLAKRMIDDLNGRSGVNLDFDEDIMQEIYHEMAMTMATELPVIIGQELHRRAAVA